LLRLTKGLAGTDELRAGQWRTDRHDDCSAEYLGRCGYPHSKAWAIGQTHAPVVGTHDRAGGGRNGICWFYEV